MNNALIQQALKKNSLLAVLKSSKKLKLLFNNIGLYDCASYLADTYLIVINTFILQNKNEFDLYLAKKISLQEIIQLFIKTIFSQKVELSKHEVLASLVKHDAAVSNIITHLLRRDLKPKEKITLLGFGLDDGAFELSLSKQLIQMGKANNVVIYGLDPYAERNSEIIYINEGDIKENSLPKFDLVTALWSLHHVSLSHRWESLKTCLGHIEKTGIAIIVEEGCYSSHLERDIELEFLLASIDALANYGLRSKYTQKKSNAFFIEYLAKQELIDIGVKANLSSEFLELTQTFPEQSIITYKSNNPCEIGKLAAGDHRV